MPIRHYRRDVNKKPGEAGAYSEAQRMQAVATYLMLGNMVLVATATGIPVDRLRHWKQLDWWKELEQDIRRGRNLEVSGRIKKIVDKVFNVLEDRVEHGDFLYDPKTGEFKRRPISAKTASDIMTKAVDRELILQKLEAKPEVQEEAILERLQSIEQTLLRASKVRKPEIIDVEPFEQDQGVLPEAVSQVDGNAS